MYKSYKQVVPHHSSGVGVEDSEYFGILGMWLVQSQRAEESQACCVDRLYPD